MINLLRAELTMLYGELKNYYINYIFFNLSILVTFIGLFYTFSFEEKQHSLILLITLVAWQLCTSAISYIGYVVQDEAMLGTLEQIFMTRTKATTVFMSKIIVNGVFNCLKALILFFICIFAFGIKDIIFQINIVDTIKIIAFIILTVFSFYALGLVFGGLSLFLKRIQSLTGVITYFLLFFTGITVEVNKLPFILRYISYVLPITWLNKIVNNIVIEKNISITNLAYFGISCIILSIVGYSVFNRCIYKAKKMGKLGQY